MTVQNYPYSIKVATYGNCVICGKELKDNPFLCEECRKANDEWLMTRKEVEAMLPWKGSGD